MKRLLFVFTFMGFIPLAHSVDNTQIQNYVDDRIRTLSESFRSVDIRSVDNIATITDVYNVLNSTNSTWSDTNTSHPPHYLSKSDVLAIHQFEYDFHQFVLSNANWPIVLKACVRKVGD